MRTYSKPSKTTFSSESESQLKDLASKSFEAQKAIDSILSKFLQPVLVGDAHRIVESILVRFHLVAREISERHESRPTLVINDEYDVQDLLEGLLKIYFDDVRSEQWTPEYAGSCKKMDFLLKLERIAIEVKKTRKGLGRSEIGDELIIDMAHYQKHSDCKTLYCFIYDPEERISNPIGLERDLSGMHENLLVKAIVVPKRA